MERVNARIISLVLTIDILGVIYVSLKILLSDYVYCPFYINKESKVFLSRIYLTVRQQ